MLGYSYLVNQALTNSRPGWWLSRSSTVQVHHEREVLDVIARLLIERIHRFSRAYDCELLIVVQGRGGGRSIDSYINGSNDPRRIVKPVMQVAEENGINLLDLATALNELIKSNPSKRKELLRGHMTAEGNRWVAEKIARELIVFSNE